MDYHGSPVPENVLPEPAVLSKARASLQTNLPPDGVGSQSAQEHIRRDICPGLSASSKSSRYYGFVTGGATTAAQFADNIVTEYDQNVQVHLPKETVATDVEYHALNMLCQLIDLEPAVWTHKTFTTGATASNIMGLACGREHVLAAAAARHGREASVAQHGLIRAMRLADVDDIQILTTVPHSSIRKAASIVGLGHDSVKDCSEQGQTNLFDMAELERALIRPRTASIIMVSFSEVNTGQFATQCTQDVQALRDLADAYHAWIHVDAAFGFMARLLPESPEYETVRRCGGGLDLADSITGDGHKLLNVPYDTGFFLSRHLSYGLQVFRNPNAAYLSSAAAGIPSPLNIGIENSRRFRALPVYANLVAYGRSGYQDMLCRQVRLARIITDFLFDNEHYDVFKPRADMQKAELLSSTFMIVLFRAKSSAVNDDLVNRINGTLRIYCSGTTWGPGAGVRFAIANWKCDPERDWPVVRQVLEDLVAVDRNA